MEEHSETFAKTYPELRGKVVIVTGAAGGIGKAVTMAFATAGARVIAADIRLDAARLLASQLVDLGFDVIPELVDIAEPKSSRRLAEITLDKLGKIDVLINNAGIDAPRGKAWELPDEHWQTIINVNLSGAFWCTKAVLPHMISKKSGRIIMISSEAAYRSSGVTSAAYNAAKAGMIGLTFGLAKQLEADGVLINAIAPGPTGTGEPISEQELLLQNKLFPLGVVGPEPVAHACLYLSGRGGDWISGSVLNVSGGRVQG